MRRCKADQEQKCQKWAATPDAYRAVSRLRMAARRALEQIGMRYEISDLLNSSVRKCFLKATGKSWGLLQIEELQAVYVYVGRGLECFKGATAPIAPMLPPPMWESTSECLYSFGYRLQFWQQLSTLKKFERVKEDHKEPTLSYLCSWLHFPQNQHHRHTQSYQTCYCR